MGARLPKLSLNHKLGAIALGLGLLAIPAKVYQGRTVTVHEKELATAVAREEDHVTPSELAAWIVEGRKDYRLIDIRDEKAYREYHIPTAESVPLAVLPDQAFGKTEKIVIYSDGGIHAAQAWMLLKGKGYTAAYTLLLGIEAWKEEVLFPVKPANATPEQAAKFERAAHLARFFGGQARVAAAGGEGSAAAPAAVPVELPKVETAAPPPMPAAPAGAAGGTEGAAPRKKKEGC